MKTATFSEATVGPGVTVPSSNLPSANAGGSNWFVLLAKPSSATRIVLSLRGGDRILASTERRLDRPDVLAVSYSADAPAPVVATIEVRDASVDVLGFVVNAETEVRVDVPIALLGPDVLGELESINSGLRQLLAEALEDSEPSMQAARIGRRIYVCGLNKVNKGTKCTIVNVIICGPKKDTHEVEQPETPQPPNQASSLDPYLTLIGDGSRLTADQANHRIDEFNALAQIIRAVDNSRRGVES